MGFALSPVLRDTALLVLLAIGYNRLTGRHYPFRQPGEEGGHKTSDAAPDRRLGLTPDELERVLERFNLGANRSEEHTSELQSLMRISYAVFCLKTTNPQQHASSLDSQAIKPNITSKP